MADDVKPYYLRFWKRSLKDATPWARDNILWGTIVLLVPPIAIYLRDPHAKIDWEVIRNTFWLYGFSFLIYALAHLCHTPRKLDDDREAREKLLTLSIADQEETIRKRDDTIRALAETPKRTVAEQHHYDTAKKVLEKLRAPAVIALRHLKTNGKLTFGFYNPQSLPAGMTGDQLQNIYRACAVEGLVAQSEKPGKGERTFEIAPTMSGVLDELLYDPTITTRAG